MNNWCPLKGWSLWGMLSFQAKSNLRLSGETSLDSTLRKTVQNMPPPLPLFSLTRCGPVSFPDFTHLCALGPLSTLCQKSACKRGSFISLYSWAWLPACSSLSLKDLHFSISWGKRSLLKKELMIGEEGTWGTGSIFRVPKIFIRITSIYWALTLWRVNHSITSDFLWPCEPTRLLCLCNSPGKNIGVDSHSFSRGSSLEKIETRFPTLFQLHIYLMRALISQFYQQGNWGLP